MSLHRHSDEFGPQTLATHDYPRLHVVQRTGETAIFSEIAQNSPRDEALNEHERVRDSIEDFLETNAEVFSDSAHAWRDVKEAQQRAEGPREQSIYTHLITTIPANPKYKPTARQHEREARKRWQAERGAVLSDAHKTSSANFNDIVLPRLTSPNRSERKITVAKLAYSYRAYVESQSRSKGAAAQVAASDGELQQVYMGAHYADYEALLAIETFLSLSNSTVSVAFMERLSELARHAKKGIIEYPGLLEVLAANNRQFGDKSVLNRVANKIVGHNGDYAAAFLKDCFIAAEAGILKKDMANAIEAIQLVAKALAVDIDKEVLIEVLANRWENWPQALADALTDHTKGHVERYRQQMRNALEPFVRQGRLPGKGSIISTRNKKRKPANRNRPHKSPGEMEIAASTQDMTDVSTEEAPRLTSVTWLNKLGTSSRNICTLERLDSIDKVLEKGHFQQYLDTYRHDKTLLPKVKDALNLLLVDPFNSAHTKRWKGTKSIKFYLVGDDKPQNVRRISLRDLPGETKAGEVATKTRIAYGIVEEGGEFHLAIYGIFHKKDIEHLNTLPPRK